MMLRTPIFLVALAMAPAAAFGAEIAPKPEAFGVGHVRDYCERNLGKWFYCETEVQPGAEPEASSHAQTPDEAALNEANAFKAEMERRRLIAVWNPTEENVRKYYQFQQVTMAKSGTFADVARRMIWSDPSLDYTLERPISVAGKSQWAETRNRDRDLFFRGISEQVGLFYVYRGRCAPCHAASPIVRQFGLRYGISIKAISADGSANPEFPEAVSDRGQLKAWGITDPVTPAFLVYQSPGSGRAMRIPVSDGRMLDLRPCTNAKGCLTYVGAGVLSVEELADRLFVTLATRPGEDF